MSDIVSSASERIFREKYGEILAALLRSSGYDHFDLADGAGRVSASVGKMDNRSARQPRRMVVCGGSNLLVTGFAA